MKRNDCAANDGGSGVSAFMVCCFSEGIKAVRIRAWAASKRMQRKRVARVEMSETDEAEGLYTKDWMEVKHTHLRAMICGKNYKSHAKYVRGLRANACSGRRRQD